MVGDRGQIAGRPTKNSSKMDKDVDALGKRGRKKVKELRLGSREGGVEEEIGKEWIRGFIMCGVDYNVISGISIM